MSDRTKLSDEALTALLSNDDLPAFEEVYKRYWKNLYAAAYKRLKDTDEAEEIVQELFTALWIKRRDLQINALLLNYLHTAVSNRIIDHYRKILTRQKHQQALDYTDYDNTTQETIFFNDLQQSVDAELNNLPPKCRSVYELSRKEFKSNKQIAQSLGISEKTVENHLTKAIRILRLNIGNYAPVIFMLFSNKR